MNVNEKHKPKIIIWGYDRNDHTQYYIHWAWYRTFEYLGYETYWFTDENYPKDFDYTNCLFIAEGYRDNNIPINKSSVYFINFLINPGKYLQHGARVIDIKLNVNEINDCNYNYVLDRSKTIKVGNCAHYENNSSDDDLSDQFKKGVSGYESVYLSWATHLFPNEINLEDSKIERENIVYWTGSIGESNYKEIDVFKRTLDQNNVQFIHINPWSNPVSSEVLRTITQKSYMAPDLRGSAFRSTQNGKPDTGANHKLIGYLPCRIFKNISFGQLGITNSKSVFELFDGNIIYNDDESQLFYDAKSQLKNYKLIQDQMTYVKENHTYVDRINSLMKIYYKEI
jgi:hypothetical protein